MKEKRSIFYKELKPLSEENYRAFTKKLVPNIDENKILGVRIPALRKLAKDLSKREPDQVQAFYQDPDHFYFDEKNLHGLLISEEKDVEHIIDLLDEFLPYVDNWATCDIISPKSFKKHPEDLPVHIKRWMASNQEYTIRFGIEMLMTHYLGENFHPSYLELVGSVRHEAYYVKMMVAWFFATALSKHYEQILRFLEQKVLDRWTHNKAIQKARESRLISEEKKEHLKSLKV